MPTGGHGVSETTARRDAAITRRLAAALGGLGVETYGIGPGPDGGITIRVGGRRVDCSTRKAAEQIAVVLEGVARAGGAA